MEDRSMQSRAGNDRSTWSVMPDRSATKMVAIYRTIAGINLVSIVVLLIYRIGCSASYSEYVHRAVNYDHGFVRRGLVGEIYSWFVTVVREPVFHLEALLTCAAALGLGGLLFQRAMRLKQPERLAFACLVFGSPLLFKNFLGNLGKFDVLGACVAMLACVLPVRISTLLLVGVLSAGLLLIHHINATLFVPTIYGVLLLRAIASSPAVAKRVSLVAAVSLAALAVLFIALMLFANPSLRPAEFQSFLQSRSMVELPGGIHRIWYSTLREDMDKTRGMFLHNVLRLPIYLAIVLVHWPLIRLGLKRLKQQRLESPVAAKVFPVVLSVVLAGYVVTFAIAYDYARFVADAAFCLVLLSGVQIVANRGPIEDLEGIDLSSPGVVCCAAVEACIPWVGTITPIL
jgi:hypothetical protein